MKKKIKKIITGTFAGLFALQAVAVLPANAATTVLGTVCINSPTFISSYGVKVSKNYVQPDTYSFLKLYSYQWYSGVMCTMSYDLTHLASEKNQVIGTQNYNFKIYTYDIDSDDLVYINLKDNKGNLIKKCVYWYAFESNSSQTFVVQTNLVNYDLDYDGKVTLEDAQLATNFAIGTKSISDLQLMIGDTNGDGTFDLVDANKILKVAISN